MRLITITIACCMLIAPTANADTQAPSLGLATATHYATGHILPLMALTASNPACQWTLGRHRRLSRYAIRYKYTFVYPDGKVWHGKLTVQRQPHQLIAFIIDNFPLQPASEQQGSTG